MDRSLLLSIPFLLFLLAENSINIIEKIKAGEEKLKDIVDLKK